MIFRYAIWAAVSTEAQAASDKVSLSEQESLCRQAAAARGWRETAGPYIVPGESRTRWVNLRDAEQAIPALRQLLDAAQHGQFDLLILYDYNRLRDLLDPVAKTLSAYNVQLFSISQPIEPQPPHEFNQYNSDAANIMQGMSRIISQAQIADLRRKYRYAMPRRASERGLPVQIPYGYRKPPGRETDRSVVPVIDPIESSVVIEAKEKLLRGLSTNQIALDFQAVGYPPPRAAKWNRTTIRDMLRNPFYAGFVRWGASKRRTDPRTGKITRDRSAANKPIVAQGRHQPLWDEVTMERLIDELEARATRYPGKRTSQLTGLLECGVCAARLWSYKLGNYGTGDPVNVWQCSAQRNHVTITHKDALARVAAELKKDLAANPANLPKPDKQEDHTAALAELAERRKRLETAYLAGALSLDALTQHGSELDRQIAVIQNRVAEQENRLALQQARLDAFSELSKIDRIDDFLANNNPQETNRLLHLLIDRIAVDTSGGVKLNYK